MIDIIHGWDTDLMATLFHEVWINAPTSRVYEKLSNAGGLSEWWTKHTATETDQGLVLESSPGPEHGIVRMKVLNLKQNARVEWECLSTHAFPVGGAVRHIRLRERFRQLPGQ